MQPDSCFYRFFARRHVLAVLALLAGLTGCASTIDARVTSYQDWPEQVVGERYRIVASPAQEGNLEFQSFADMVRAAIGPVGLVEARDGSAARFEVSLEYGNPVERTWVQRYQDPYYGGWGFSPFFGGFYGRHGGWGWGSGLYVTPSPANVQVDIYRNSLTVVIRDGAASNREVYRSSAVSPSETENLAAIMPYLAQAVFDGFPGNNGQVRTVRYDRAR